MSIFREYDVRGIADTELTNPIAWGLGRAIAEKIQPGDKNVYVGQDVRLSSPRLADALAAGLEAGGMKVRKLKAGPTPLLYYCAHQSTPDFATSSGVMVTGSHNPPEYNGFKMVINGKTIYGDQIQALQNRVLSFASEAPAQIKSTAQTIDRSQEYVDFVKGNLKLGRKLKVVVDAGNGAGGDLALRTYQALGCEVIPLFCEPDGRFPNHHPDPTVPKNLEFLVKKVRETGADVGIGLDGDADRIGAVTATGRILYGDHLVLFFARDILQSEPGATVISEVKSSQVLYDTLEKWGARPILWKTGHSLIKAKLKETRAALAGEMSGHMFFANRFFGFDDAVYAGGRLIEGLSNRKETLDQFLDSLPAMVNTPELRVDCADEVKFKIVDDFTKAAKNKFGEAVNDIDGARIKMHGGWGLLRASNTQPVLVMRFEAPDSTRLQQVRDEFCALFKTIGAEVQVPTV